MWGKSKKSTAVKKALPNKAPAKKATTKKTSAKDNKNLNTNEEEKYLDYETIFNVYATDKEMGKSIIGGDGIVCLCNDWKFDLASSAELLVFMWMCE